MSSPFPHLPKISDENLARWLRHLGRRPRPRLKPVTGSPVIGGFSLTARVSPEPRPSRDPSVASGACSDSDGSPLRSPLRARASKGSVSRSKSSPALRTESRTGELYGGSRASTAGRRGHNTSSTASAKTGGDTLEVTVTPAALAQLVADDSLPPPLAGSGPPGEPGTQLLPDFGSEAKCAPPAPEGEQTITRKRRGRGPPAYLRLYQSAKSKSGTVLDKDNFDRSRKLALEEAELHKQEVQLRIQQEHSIVKAKVQEKRDDRRRRRLMTQDAMLSISPQAPFPVDFEAEHADDDNGDELQAPTASDGSPARIPVEMVSPCKSTARSLYDGGEDYDDDKFSDEECEAMADTLSDQPVAVELPRCFPAKVQLDTMGWTTGRLRDQDFQEPAAPVVECVGTGKIMVQWQLPTPLHVSLMWHIRIKHADHGEEGWLPVDLDSGRIASEIGWKTRASVAQAGLLVWCHCIEDSTKSLEPRLGEMLAHFPGLVVIDFIGKGRQRVPQDWVQYASAAKGKEEIEEIKHAVLDALNAAKSKVGSPTRTHASELWKKAQQNWWTVADDASITKKHRIRRQCPVIYADASEAPVPGDRVALACTMLVEAAVSSAPAGTDRLELKRATTSAIDFGLLDEDFGNRSLYSWWPAVRCQGPDDNEDEEYGRDRPPDLCMSSDVPVVLEPWPRIQVVPKSFLNTKASGQALVAAQSACPGQEVLAYYRPAFGMVPSLSLEESLRHPVAKSEGDVTLLQCSANVASLETVAEEPRQSERCVRAQVLREFISAAETTVHVRFYKTKEMRAQTADVSLAYICEVLASREDRMTKKCYDKKVIQHWTFQKDKQCGVKVVAVQVSTEDGNLLDPVELTEGLDVLVRVGPDGRKAKRPIQAKVLRIRAVPTHYELKYEDVVAPGVQHISAEMLHAVLEEEGPERWKHPTLVLHDLPDDLDFIEVQVGVSHSGLRGSKQSQVLWSAASARCTVQTRNETLFAPVGPGSWPTGVSKAEVCWLSPKKPCALCFRMRVREVTSTAIGLARLELDQYCNPVDDNYRGTGRQRIRDDATGLYWVELEDGTFAEQVWESIDSFGNHGSAETSMAWQSLIVPLRIGLWVLAYGQVGGQKTATPSPAVVYEILHNTHVKLQFACPAQELLLGGDEIAELTRSDHDDFTTPQEIPIEWIDCVWVQEGKHFFKGKPSVMCRPSQRVRFEPESEGCYLAYLDDSNEPIKSLVAQSVMVQELHGRQTKDGRIIAEAMVGLSTLRRLQPKCDYEICVQALTDDGWTPWTEIEVLSMPTTSYDQEELAIELQANSLAKSQLLFHAFYKESALCRESILNALSQERFDRIRRALEREVDTVHPKIRGQLVSLTGPVRLSNTVTLEEARIAIQSLVERRADVNHRDSSVGRSPLHLAVEYFAYGRKLQIIKDLVELRADVDIMNDSRITPLICAAERGHDEIVEYLLVEHRADATIIDINIPGRTAYLSAKAELRSTPEEREGVERCRELLRRDRVPWTVFEQEVLALAETSPDELDMVARAFLKLAFPDIAKPSKKALFITDVQAKLGKRICKLDRFRLYEQIEEAGEKDPQERLRLGRRCGETLLLPLLRAAATPPPQEAVSLFTWYLLYSDVAKFVIGDVRRTATELLDMHEVELRRLRGELRVLPTLTTSGTSYPPAYGGPRELFNGNPLHQWHAHSNLEWLSQQNCVNAFEALINCNTFSALEDICSWIGELNAGIAACDPDPNTKLGAWDPRLPDIFWGALYVQWLLSEADRVAPMFHQIAEELVKHVGREDVGKTIRYDKAPNKGKVRVEKKQKDYASPGLRILHEALDLMPGCFSKVVRADLEGGLKQVLPHDVNAVNFATPILIFGAWRPCGVGKSIADVLHAVSMVKRQVDEEVARKRKGSKDGEAVSNEEKELDKAIAVLKRSKPADLTELRSLGQPPPIILKVAEAVMIVLPSLLKQDTRNPVHREASVRRPAITDEPTTHSGIWAAFAKDVLGIGLEGFRHLFVDFDKDMIPNETIHKLEPILKSKDFQMALIQYKTGENRLLRPLATWIQSLYEYHHAVVNPMRRKFGKSMSASVSVGELEQQSERPPVIVVLVKYPGVDAKLLDELQAQFQNAGADATVTKDFNALEGEGARQLLVDGLKEAQRHLGLAEEVPHIPRIDSMKAQLLFETRKCKSGSVDDLYTAGGLLDLVRGSIVCSDEEQVRHVYEQAMALTIKDNGCQVMRIKNGFHTPAVGGYCDLKVFLFIAKDEITGAKGNVNKCYHICELQIHLQRFLDCKQYTHLPYQADRGDFDPS